MYMETLLKWLTNLYKIISDLKLGQFKEGELWRNTLLGKKDKRIWRHTSSIMQRCVWTKHNRGMDKKPPVFQEWWPLNHKELESHKSYCYSCDCLLYTASQFWEKQISFRRNIFSQSIELSKEYEQKNLSATLLFVEFFLAFNFIKKNN